MSLRLFAFTCGTVTAEFGRLMADGEGEITVPVPVFLIEHPKGRALFDAGLHPDCRLDPVGRLGPRLAGLFEIGLAPGEEVSARLEAIDRDPGRIDLLINSHFHFGHVGGNALIPNATMVVQRREWEAAADPDRSVRHGYNQRDFDLGHRRLLVDACYFCRTLRERRLPRHVDDREAMLSALDRLARLEALGARIFFGHDPEFWRGVPQAPAAIA
jgi:N-acyl homoserine lactone hydrolase